MCCDLLRADDVERITDRIKIMSEDEAYNAFRQIRWSVTNGEPVCPRCKCDAAYKLNTRKIFVCKACSYRYSVTAGTIFANHKLSMRDILLAIAIIGRGNSPSALQLSRDLDCQYKTAFVLAHKIREALIDEEGLDIILTRAPSRKWNKYWQRHLLSAVALGGSAA